MTNIFVTGAGGFIGSRLVWELLQRGHTVHALTRNGKITTPPGFPPEQRPDFSHPNLRIFCGDVTKPESFRAAMDGCSQVYHLAGYAKNWARNLKTYLDINVLGLLQVAVTARELKVDRFVWTSSLLTSGPSLPGQIIDEATPRNFPYSFTQYEGSKLEAEKIAVSLVSKGHHLVTVSPGRVFGPGYLSEGNSVSLLIDMYDRGKLPFLLGGRNVGNWVLVDDVVQGLILALERGRSGEKYMLGGENASLKQFLSLVDKVSGRRHFQITIRRPAGMTYAWLQQKRAQRFGIHPQITPDWVRVFLTDWAYSSAKAERELGYRITPLEEAVRITYDWLLRVRSQT